MNSNNQSLIKSIENYYSNKIRQYGNTPKGVDWKDDSSQLIRFVQVLKIIDRDNNFTINDLGCGYGALYQFMKNKYKNFQYHGIDISKNMIESALSNLKFDNASFEISNTPESIADYSVASGIFNVKLNANNNDWLSYIKKTLEIMNKKSIKGFSFNCLSIYSDKDKMRDDLYYADPLILFDYLKKEYSKNVSLLHDYNLYEFTMLVKK
jgi:SAM-dependent methyltransferase